MTLKNDVCVIKVESWYKIPTDTSGKTHLHWFRTHVYARSCIHLCQKATLTSKLPQYRLEIKFKHRDSNIYVAIKKMIKPGK